MEAMDEDQPVELEVNIQKMLAPLAMVVCLTGQTLAGIHQQLRRPR